MMRWPGPRRLSAGLLLEGEIAAKFLAAILTQSRVMRLLSSQHFSVDGTLVEAWASLKSLKPRNGSNGNDEPPSGGRRNAEVDFRGEKRSNQTHVSTSDHDRAIGTSLPQNDRYLAAGPLRCGSTI
jgi:hypothetical protein